MGTVRTYKDSVVKLIKEKISDISMTTAKAFGCTAEVTIWDKYPPTVNHKREAEHVARIAKRYFGEDKVKSEGLPMTAAEDFSHYLEHKPGCFYMLGSKKPGENYSLHTSFYDYNDTIIASGALIFVRILEDRLNFTILN